MRPLRRRTRFEKLVKTARDAAGDVKLPSNIGAAVSDIHPPKSVTTGATADACAGAVVHVLAAGRPRVDVVRRPVRVEHAVVKGHGGLRHAEAANEQPVCGVQTASLLRVGRSRHET